MYQSEHFDYDVVIVGGGLVGAALACALGNSVLRVAVLESASIPEPDEPYDLRVSAVTLASRALLEAVGAWPGVAARRFTPIREMQVWDEGGQGAIHFDSADIGAAELGYIIENTTMLRALYERIDALTNVQLLRPAQVDTMESDERRAQLTLADGRALSTRLIVGADGARSRVRALAGIETRGRPFDQTAIVATVRTERPHRDTARQRFLSSGPLAFLPLPDPLYCSIVWSADTARAAELLALDDAGFDDELYRCFGPGLGRLEIVGRRAGFPLTWAHARHYVQPRLALVGDAAHRVHPLAGQGANLGFMDTAVLAQVLRDAVAGNKDVGAYTVLRRYERWRKADNSAMLVVTDGFKQLFGQPHPLARHLRNLALDAGDRLIPIKRKIVRVAAGLDGDFPPLLRAHLPL